jgi:hypothetical protein
VQIGASNEANSDQILNNLATGENKLPQYEMNNKNDLKHYCLYKIKNSKNYTKKISAKIHKHITPHKTGNRDYSFNPSKKHTNVNSIQPSKSTNQSSIRQSQEYLNENKSTLTESEYDNGTNGNQTSNAINNDTVINSTFLNQSRNTNSSTNQTDYNNTVMNQTCLNSTGNQTANTTTTTIYPEESTKDKVTDTLLAIGYASAAIAALCAMNPEPVASKVICAVAVTVAVISFVAVIFCKWLW